MTQTAAKDLDAYYADQRRSALFHVTHSRDEAMLDGIEMDSFAQAALFVAFQEMVEAYGEVAVAAYASRLPGRVSNGEFTASKTHQ